MSTPVAVPAPVLDSRWELVQKVAVSAIFQRSPRLRELLLYICERALNGHREDLHEQTIGCAVFGRKPQYNAADDNIVRVEMRQLRKRLEEYFAAEGRDDPTVIVIPKGAYIPLFEPREPKLKASPDIPPAPKPALFAGPIRRWLLWTQAVVILILAGTHLWMWRANQKRESPVGVPARLAPARSVLWPLMFGSDRETLVICADSGLVVAQALLHRGVTLEEYAGATYGEGLPEPMTKWQFTDVADVRLVQRLYRLNADYWDNVSIRNARTTHMQDFKTANAVLLGSARSNPWTRLFEPALNFVFEFDEKTRTPFIRNRAPRAGEDAVYRGAKPGDTGDTYSMIALVPNLRNSGNVLIIAGTSAEGTETAGEYIMDRDASAGLLDTLRKNREPLPYFEVLLRSRTVAGVAKNAEPVASRVLPGNPFRR
jgi:hypothetical protein